jgi:23S rRNA pseudouridine1911/1915/1917 synthase
VSVGIPQARPSILVPEPGPVDILFEDDWLMAVNKSPGIPMHPGTGHATGSLANRLVALGRTLSTGGSWERPGIVHRLDRDTTGVVLVAKDDGTHAALSAQFESRTVRKTYSAFVSGVPNPPRQQVVAGIMRNKRQPELMTVGDVPPARSAETDIRVISDNGRIAVIECKPRTGRTHQIRVHAMHIGHPLLGDTAYGGPVEIRRANRDAGPFSVARPMLHARSIAFTHPARGQVVELTAPWPDDFLETARAAGVELPR